MKLKLKLKFSQRAEAQRVAAALNADTQPLSLELVEIVIKRLPRSQLASARLVSKQFAAAVDPLIRAADISLKKSWDGRVAPFVGLQHVTRLDVGSGVQDSDRWRQLQHNTSQLPKLNTLRFLSELDSFPGAFASSLSSLSGLTRLDLASGNPFPKGVRLRGLKAARFYTCHLAVIAAVAPNLEQLHCHYLEIGAQWVGDDPVILKMIFSGRPVALSTCTHFGGDHLDITSTEPAQAFAAAFPNLQVVTHMPSAVQRPHDKSIAFRRMSAQQLLARLPSVRAVRGWSAEVMPKSAAAGPLTLPQLQRLCLHAQNVLDIPSISSMSQLQHVRITFDKGGDTTSQALLRALAALPQLQSLVLPAGSLVLCSQCCPGVQSSLAALTAKSSLKQLVFVEWQQPFTGWSKAGPGCTHPEAIQAGLQSVAAAAAAAASTQAREQRQQQLAVLHQQQHEEVMPNAWRANPDSAAGVWGVYGPPGEW